MGKNVPGRRRNRQVGGTVPGPHENHAGGTALGAEVLRARAAEGRLRTATEAGLHRQSSRPFCEDGDSLSVLHRGSH